MCVQVPATPHTCIMHKRALPHSAAPCVCGGRGGGERHFLMLFVCGRKDGASTPLCCVGPWSHTAPCGLSCGTALHGHAGLLASQDPQAVLHHASPPLGEQLSTWCCGGRRSPETLGAAAARAIGTVAAGWQSRCHTFVPCRQHAAHDLPHWTLLI